MDSMTRPFGIGLEFQNLIFFCDPLAPRVSNRYTIRKSNTLEIGKRLRERRS